MVDPEASAVKRRRSYDSSRRRAAERANRRRMLEVARRLFLSTGYAATTVAQVATGSGVSVESVYRLGGGKAGLVRALCADALLGEGAVPAERRSDRLQTEARSAPELLRHWVDLVAEVSPRVSPLHLVVRQGAAADPSLAGLLAELDDARLERMTHNARNLVALEGARAGLTVEAAAEVLWLYTAPEWYEKLVRVRGWSVRAYAEFVGDALAAALLDPEQRAGRTGVQPE
jgi:AcrR family transcriptional regulator